MFVNSKWAFRRSEKAIDKKLAIFGFKKVLFPEEAKKLSEEVGIPWFHNGLLSKSLKTDDNSDRSLPTTWTTSTDRRNHRNQEDETTGTLPGLHHRLPIRPTSTSYTNIGQTSADLLQSITKGSKICFKQRQDPILWPFTSRATGKISHLLQQDFTEAWTFPSLTKYPSDHPFACLSHSMWKSKRHFFCKEYHQHQILHSYRNSTSKRHANTFWMILSSDMKPSSKLY